MVKFRAPESNRMPNSGRRNLVAAAARLTPPPGRALRATVEPSSGATPSREGRPPAVTPIGDPVAAATAAPRHRAGRGDRTIDRVDPPAPANRPGRHDNPDNGDLGAARVDPSHPRTQPGAPLSTRNSEPGCVLRATT